MRPVLLLTLAALGLAYPVYAHQDREDPGTTIVVTGRSLSDTERGLKDCIAKACPPEADIAATLAHAENQFVAGRYKDARGTLLAGIGRNRRYAARLPVEVSDLLRANARIAGHLGEGDAQRLGMIDSLDALRAGLPGEDPRILVQRVEVGDALARVGRVKAAEDAYLAVARDARRLGHDRVEGFAMLRRAWLLATLAKNDPARYRNRARQALDAVAARRGPEFTPFAGAARVLRARMLHGEGDRNAFDALIADFVRIPPSLRPVLVYSEPVDLGDLMPDVGAAVKIGSARSEVWGASANGYRGTGTGRDDQWIDVIFWIRPDGTPAEVEVARRGSDERPAWESAVVRSIATRRYLPMAFDPTEPGLMRVERYTLVADHSDRGTQVSGTRLRNRELQPKVEMLDLSAEAPPTRDPGKG